MTEDFDMICVNSLKSHCDLPATLFCHWRGRSNWGCVRGFWHRYRKQDVADVFCKPNVRVKLRRIVGEPSKTMRYTLKKDDLFVLDAIGLARKAMIVILSRN